MAELTASRTLVKSSPELWAECSDAESLARHLGAFGEIRITRLEPETAVAWEGEDVRGTVTLEPSGWGTRVVLTAETARAAVPAPVEPEPEPVAVPAPVEAIAELEPEPAREPADAEPVIARRGRFAWLAFWRRPTPAQATPPPLEEPAEAEPVAAEPVQTPDPDPDPAPVPEPEPAAEVAPSEVLVGALDSLGQAHRRPFSHG